MANPEWVLSICKICKLFNYYVELFNLYFSYPSAEIDLHDFQRKWSNTLLFSDTTAQQGNLQFHEVEQDCIFSTQTFSLRTIDLPISR